MPPEIVEQELYKIFGGYSEYMDAPYTVVQKHKLVLQARWSVEAEQNEETSKEIARVKAASGA